MLTATECPSSLVRATPTQAMPTSFSSISSDQPRRRVCSTISCRRGRGSAGPTDAAYGASPDPVTPSAASRRSEEHTSELQSRFDLVCRLLLEKKKKTLNQTSKRTHDAWAGA